MYYMCAHAYVYDCACGPVLRMCMYMCVRMCMCVYRCVSVCVCVCMCLCVTMNCLPFSRE